MSSNGRSKATPVTPPVITLSSMEHLAPLANKLLTLATLAEGSPVRCLLARCEAPLEEARQELNRIVSQGLLRLELATTGHTVVFPTPALNRAPWTVRSPELDCILRAQKALRQGTQHASPAQLPALSRMNRLEVAADALIPQRCADRVPSWLRQLCRRQELTVTVTGVEPEPDIQWPPDVPGVTKWWPMPTPFVIAWPGKLAIFRPANSSEILTSHNSQLCTDLAVFASTLRRYALETHDLICAKVISLLNQGHTDASAAKRLGITERHFRRHVASILAEANATSRWQAAALLNRDS